MPDHLGDRTWREARASQEETVLAIPLGSCEQHGPHLPLGTDTRVACALADELATLRPGVVRAPALSFGASWEHRGFPGLLSLTTGLVEELLVELARSAEWAEGVVFVNGHGGNTAGIVRAVERIRGEGRRALAWWPNVPGGDAHAGRTETSIMLALDPRLVRTAAAVPGYTGPLDRVRDEGVRAVSASGVLGDPTAASADEGRWLLADLTTDLLAAYDRWRV